MLPMLIPMLTNVVGGLVADTATNLAKEHVMDMVEKVIPPEAKAVIDQVVSADPTNPCHSMTELIERIADPLDDNVPSVPQMPAMADMPAMCNDMMAGALADDGMEWANTMVDMAGTAISGGPISIDCRVSLDPTTMDISVEKL